MLFDEADYIIPYHADHAVKEDRTLIKAIYSETDVFILLCAMYLVKTGPMQIIIPTIYRKKLW